MFLRTPHSKISWIQWSILAVALVAGLTVRAIYANVNLFLSVDAVYYVSQARDLAATGHLPLSSFPPGWWVFQSFRTLIPVHSGQTFQFYPDNDSSSFRTLPLEVSTVDYF